MRRTFELDSIKFNRPQLLIHHDEDAEIYINSQLVAKLKGYTSGYILFRLDEKEQKKLKVGINSLAVHCSQTEGGQYIDVGLVDLIEQ
jgi:beta-galactosidase